MLLLAALSLLGFAFLASAQHEEVVEEQEARAVTVFLVRHAEKSSDDPRDPSLTEAGEARAKELARLLSAAGVTHLFSTPYKRTRSTLAPLAAATSLELAPYDARDPRGLLKSLAALPAGSCAVVSGHSNTTPAYFNALGGQAQDLEDSSYGRVIPDATYDRLYVVTFTAGSDGERETHSTLELRYGE